MSNAQELLARLKQQKEEIEALQQYWGEYFPDSLTNVQAKAWLDKYPFDTVVAGLDAAIVQINKRAQTDEPMDAADVVRYASAAMRNIAMPEEERNARHAERVESGRKGGQARVPKGRYHGLNKASKSFKELERASPELDGASKSLPCYGSGSGSSSHSFSCTETDSAEAKPSSLRSLPPSPSATAARSTPNEEQKQNQKNPEPTPSGPLGAGANKNRKPKTAADGTPYPQGFDSWANSTRLDWLEKHKLSSAPMTEGNKPPCPCRMPKGRHTASCISGLHEFEHESLVGKVAEL